MNGGAQLVWLAEIWLWIGAATALVFLTFGIGRIDPDARGSDSFRPLLVPGVVLLWPLVLWRWLEIERHGLESGGRDRPLRDAHAVVWFVLAVAIPVILVGALIVSQSEPDPASSAVQIQAPR